MSQMQFIMGLLLTQQKEQELRRQGLEVPSSFTLLHALLFGLSNNTVLPYLVLLQSGKGRAPAKTIPQPAPAVAKPKSLLPALIQTQEKPKAADSSAASHKPNRKGSQASINPSPVNPLESEAGE